MSELGLLADELGVHERTLRRAAEQGTLRATRPGPRALNLPLGERRYARRAWPLLAALLLLAPLLFALPGCLGSTNARNRSASAL